MSNCSGAKKHVVKGLKLVVVIVLAFGSYSVFGGAKSCAEVVSRDATEFGTYLATFNNFSRLTQEEERDLFLKKEKGTLAQEELKTLPVDEPSRLKLIRNVEDGRAARDQFIFSNRRLVIFWAKKYINRGVSFEDLVSEGILGLITAVDRYDLNRGARFSTFASFWIRKYVREYVIRYSTTVSIPENAYRLAIRYFEAAEAISKWNDVVTDFDEVVNSLGLSQLQIETLRYTLTALRKEFSAAGPDDDENRLENKLYDRGSLPPDEELLLREAENALKKESSRLHNALSVMDSKYSTVLRMRFFQGKTRAESGEAFGVTRERARQIERVAIEQLKLLLSQRSPD